MKHFLPVAWWLAATVVIALVLVSLGYRFGEALQLGVPFLPGMLAARYFVPQLSFAERRKGIFDAAYLTLAILCIEYLSLILTGRYILDIYPSEMPDILLNPVFLLLVPAAFVTPEIMLENYIAARHPYDKTIRFVSDRRRITLDPAEILYVESNDSEVWLHTADGAAYRTKTRISQWESQLDRRFLRIHRSYIVNTGHIDEYHSARVAVGGQSIEISRKYKDEARQRLGTPSASVPERTDSAQRE
ncbi:LytTR family DNA-binding domain-containing protein [uncultured Alistipes sp.]|uniref:LytR/AlgR family response regulator transcription factor n=1 Tax=uncultured Alistipes sp. TaxID=538949 RepID=UPI0025E6D97B|nr:LytTR family DNA-binding domain-containing protein [uncultured Alistipes sp.]